jgi:chemotaxis protein MotB
MSNYGVLQDEGLEEEPWLVVMTDLLSLILTFFILLFAVSDVKKEEWVKVSASLGNSEFKTFEESESLSQNELGIKKVRETEGESLKYLEKLMIAKLERSPEIKEAVIFTRQGRVVVAFPLELVFAPGSAEVRAEAMEKAAALGNIFKDLENQISVIGHADPSPIASSNYPSNWELSMARAASIAYYIEAAGYSRKPNVYGLADARIGDLPKSLKKDSLFSAARRVEVEISEFSPQ